MVHEIAFVIPVFNEESVLERVIQDLDKDFEQFYRTFNIVNDCSTDSTSKVLVELSQRFPINIITNQFNLGHGQSLITGLRETANSNPQTIIALDGDGHFRGSEIRKLYDYLLSHNHIQVIEGIRVGRKESAFRKPVSLITRLIVLLKSNKTSKDANTPLRLYRGEIMHSILSQVPHQSMVPNLHISIIVRKNKLQISTQQVSWHNIKGQDLSSTWKQKRKFVPPRKFISFCLKAIREFA
jgi:dolichol-phosphate mannosyltransferase